MITPRAAPRPQVKTGRAPGANLRRSRHAARPSGDLAALAALLAIIAVTVGFRFVYDNWLAQFDIFSYFLPNYGYVGARIRALQVPAWNPYFSSGTPIAGDASGGWMYLPVMVAFALFTNVGTAMKVMVLLQTLIGGIATYMFGRRLGLYPLAALFAASALAVGPALYDATGQSTVIGQISAWVPVGLVGAEYAMHACRWSARLAWSGLCGVALVEMFAAWPQGFIYGTMLVAGWYAYRGLLAPIPGNGPRTVQFARALISGAVAGVFALDFGAAAILPRLDFLAQSTIAGANYAGALGGSYIAHPTPFIQVLSYYLQDSLFWRIIEFNSAILVLGLLAILLGPHRYGVRFFVVSALVFIDLAVTESVTRGWFGRLPLVGTIHSHRPTATMYMVYLPFAMLAGAGVQMLLSGPHVRSTSLRKLVPLPILLLGILAAKGAGAQVGWTQTWIAVLGAALILVPAIALPTAWRRVRRRVPQFAAICLLGLSLLYPTGRDFLWTMRHPQNYKNNLLAANTSLRQTIQTVLAPHDPATAAALLQHLQATQPPFRYAAYFGSGVTTNQNSSAIATHASIVAILAGARSARLGLEQISGYNPLHLKYYANFIAAMNGAQQDYHWLDVFAPALSSQLLNMLNVRYVLVPTNLSHPPAIASYGKAIYRDDQVIVYENPRAFPRAWIVHDVRSDPNGNGLALLASGAVNGHTVAFVAGPAPPVAVPGRPGGPASVADDSVVVTRERPESLTLRASSPTAGLLVVSEPYANGWDAYVDGTRVVVERTDYALQGVPLPAGGHTVILKYQPTSLTIGLPVTGVATLVLIGVCAWSASDLVRRRLRRAAPTRTGKRIPMRWSRRARHTA